MNFLQLALLLGGGYLLVSSKSSKKSSQSITTTKPTEETKPTTGEKNNESTPPQQTPSKGYDYVNCQTVEEKNILDAINYAKYVGANIPLQEWDSNLFGNCKNPVDYFANPSMAYFSFNLYKNACIGAIEAGKISKDDAIKILLQFRETAYATGIEESETWFVDLQT
jgi:hypothetical protein